MTDKKRKTGTELIKSLHDLICGDDLDKAATMPMEEVHSYLKKNNIAHDQIIAHVQTRLQKMKAKFQLDEAREIRTNLLGKLNNALPSPADLKASVKSLIDNLKTEKPQLASAYFRKYESATENDLASLYQDLLALEQIDKNDAEK